MIQNIAGGQGIMITGNNAATPYVDMSRPSAGMVRYNGTNGTLEIYDGQNWISYSAGFPMISLSPDIHELLQWAKIKRNEEFTMRELVVKYPALADAHQQVLTAKEQFKLLSILALDEEKNNAKR